MAGGSLAEGRYAQQRPGQGHRARGQQALLDHVVSTAHACSA